MGEEKKVTVKVGYLESGVKVEPPSGYTVEVKTFTGKKVKK